MERALVGLPDEATVLATELQGREGPLHVLGIGVDYWPLDFPQLVIDWGLPGCAPKIVIFRAFISIGWLRAPVWEVRWSWQQPQAEPVYRYIKGNAPPTPAQHEKLGRALGRLHEMASDAHRPRGTGNFPDCDSFAARLSDFLEERERSNVKITSVSTLAKEWGVLGRSQIFTNFDRCKMAHERWRQHKQRPLRRS